MVRKVFTGKGILLMGSLSGYGTTNLFNIVVSGTLGTSCTGDRDR